MQSNDISGSHIAPKKSRKGLWFGLALAGTAALALVIVLFNFSSLVPVGENHVCYASLGPYPISNFADSNFGGTFQTEFKLKLNNQLNISVFFDPIDAEGLVSDGERLDVLVRRGTTVFFLRQAAIKVKQDEPDEKLEGEFELEGDRDFPNEDAPRIGHIVEIGRNLDQPNAQILLQGSVRINQDCLPDPLIGIDADQNGVRDDIDEYITTTYPDSPATRAGLVQYAQELQQALVDAESFQASMDHAIKSDRAIECLFYIRPNDADDVLDLLFANLVDTPERTNAFFLYDQKLWGQVFPSVPPHQQKLSCAFDPDTIQN